MITNFRKLANGATFFLLNYPGNVYRKHGAGSAELAVSRHTNAWNGSVLRDFGTDRMVATDPRDTQPVCECCGDPVDNPFSASLCVVCHLYVEVAPFPTPPCSLCGKPAQRNEGLCNGCYAELEYPEEGEDLL